MGLQNLRDIPFLSQELNLLGYPRLPYSVRRKSDTGDEERTELVKADSDFSEANPENADAEIIFDSKEMIGSLVNVCDALVKDIKMSCFSKDSDSDEYDRIMFEKCNLQKRFDSLKAELEKNLDIMSEQNKKSKELTDKVNELKGKVKALEKEKLKIIQQSKLNEEIIKHKNRVIEKDLLELQTILYQKSKALDVRYLPGNFQICNSKYPDFTKLWSEVKYSSATNKEMALKKAVCIFQENNQMLMAENYSLKNVLFVLLEEINKLADCMYTKMNVSIRKLHAKDLSDIFLCDTDLQLNRYKEYVQRIVRTFINVLNICNKMSFFVGDNLFVCLTDVMDEIRNEWEH